MRQGSTKTLGLLAAFLAASGPVLAEEKTFVGGDGTRFTLALENGLPVRGESDSATFEASGFDIRTDAAPVIVDRFSFIFKSNNTPRRVRIEDITLAEPVAIVESEVPRELPGAGFRRVRHELRSAPCAIAHGEPCSAWMFGEQEYRLYRATLSFEDGTTETLLQAEPYQMGAFIARIAASIPDHRPKTETPDPQP